MAIDTAAKRASILGFGSGDLLPIPDGTIAVADRLTFLWLYGGIEPSNAALFANLMFTLDNERPEFTLPYSPEVTLGDNRTEFTLEG